MRRYGSGQVDELRKLVVVSKILDANRFLGAWRGQHYECRALPGTSLLTEGEAAFCHVLPGSTELVAVLRETEVLYLGLCEQPGSGRAFLYQYDGVRDPELLWTLSPQGDDAWIEISALCWCQATNSLFIAAWGGVGFYSEHHYIFEWKPGEASPTLRHGPYLHENSRRPGYYNEDPGVDFCEWGGKLYIVHQGQDEDPAFLSRFDPSNVATTFEDVLEFGDFTYSLGEGGIVAFDNRIYCVGSEEIWYSTTGAPGTWAKLVDLWDDMSCGQASGAVRDPVSGEAFFACVYENGGTVTSRIYRLSADGTLTLESETDYYDEFDPVQIAIPYGDSNRQPVAISWYAYVDWPWLVYRRQLDGTWSEEDVWYPSPKQMATTGCNQGALYFKNKLHVLVPDYYNGIYHMVLYRRNAIGDWEVVHVFDDRYYFTTYHFGVTMTLGKTNKYIQNI